MGQNRQSLICSKRETPWRSSNLTVRVRHAATPRPQFASKGYAHGTASSVVVMKWNLMVKRQPQTPHCAIPTLQRPTGGTATCRFLLLSTKHFLLACSFLNFFDTYQKQVNMSKMLGACWAIFSKLRFPLPIEEHHFKGD